MSATFAENSKQGTPKRTAEQAEEAMMETETAAVTTEQPGASEPLPVEGQTAAAAGVLDPDGQGTPVDVVPPATPPVAKSEDKAQANPDENKNKQEEIKPKEEAKKEETKVSPETAEGAEAKVADNAAADKAKKVNSAEESDGVSKEEKVNKEPDVKSDVKEQDTVKSDDISEESNIDKKDDVPKKSENLDKLEKQIDDFDVILEKNKPSSLSKTGGKGSDKSEDALTDEIIDELIEKASNITDVEAGVPQKANNGASEQVLSDDDVGEVTPDNGLSDDSPTESKDINPLLCSAVDTNEGTHVNGKDPEDIMTASTELDGITEEKSKEGKSEQTVKTENQTKDNSSVKKSEEQKKENSSPTKTSKSKKKEDKSIEHILKALSSLQTTEEKLAALCKKYADLHEDHRVIQASHKQNQRKLTVITREKDQLQTEHTKAVMAKSKLESLCRELQKHNQTIRQESLQRAKEEDEKRKEISQKFQTTIGEIQQQMTENGERNKQLREENFELANKLKKFIEQYETREKQVEKLIQHRELEQKLADAKLEQASAILMEEKTRSQKDREMLLLQTADGMKKIQLKDAELKMYKERYEEFQSTIKKSEEMFTKFKTEMDKMTKRTRKLEKETAQWRSKWENANRAVLEMAEEKQRYDKEKGLLMSKITKLESLCRAMQAERKARKVLESECSADFSKLLLEPDSTVGEPLEIDPTPSPVSDSPSPAQQQEQQPQVPRSSIEDIDEDDDDDSDLSSASETTGVTVIQSDSSTAQPPDTSQSEEAAKQTSDQSESGTEQTSQVEANQPIPTAS